jgi:bisphosphoglycerate-dependent phosphoglycerate mutase
MKIKRKKREGKRKKNGRKYARLQGQRKEKDPVHYESEQGLKLCGFI